MTPTALLIGGTGPTGPPIVAGLEARGYEVTILHSGSHEVPEVAHLRHLHGDVFSDDGLPRPCSATRPSTSRSPATAGCARIAECSSAASGRLLSIGGVPVYRGFFDPAVHEPPGLPVPTREDAELATEADDGKSYRIGRTEQLLFDTHPTATHFRYPYVYGPRQLAPREWCVVRRILDGRPFLVLPDDGLSLIPFGYVDNLAHAAAARRRSTPGVDGRDLQLRRRREAHHPPGRRAHHRRARPRVGAAVDAGRVRASRPGR